MCWARYFRACIRTERGLDSVITGWYNINSCEYTQLRNEFISVARENTDMLRMGAQALLLVGAFFVEA
jgi:hypothetical protein